MKGYINANTKIKSDNPQNPEIMSPEAVSDMIARNVPSYIEDNIDDIRTKINEYSTYEQLVGKWIDGREIYSKTIEFDTEYRINYRNWTTLPINTPNIAIMLNAFCLNVENVCYPLMGNPEGSFLACRSNEEAYCKILHIVYVKE